MAELIFTHLRFVSDIGDKYLVLPFFSLLLIVGLFLSKYKKESLMLFLAAISSFYALLLKGLLKMPRPPSAEENLAGFNAYGFPSSHTLYYTVFLGFVMYLCLKLQKLNLVGRLITFVVSAYLILLIGVSRVYLGQHYFTDVLGGYVIGAIILGILIALDHRYNK